jgi:hypothetical protein
MPARYPGGCRRVLIITPSSIAAAAVFIFSRPPPWIRYGSIFDFGLAAQAKNRRRAMVLVAVSLLSLRVGGLQRYFSFFNCCEFWGWAWGWGLG